MKKLILEELNDEELTMDIPSEVNPVELTPQETVNFHVSTVTDILNMYLQNYNTLNSYLANVYEYDEGVKEVLQSVLDDTAVIIGKLQGTLNISAGDSQTELIDSGTEAAKDILNNNSSENVEGQ